MTALLFAHLLHLTGFLPAATGGMEPTLRPLVLLPAEPTEGEPLQVAFLAGPCEWPVAEPGYPRWGVQDGAIVVTVALLQAPRGACDVLPSLGSVTLRAPAAGAYRVDLRQRGPGRESDDYSIARGRLRVLAAPSWWQRPAPRVAAIGAVLLGLWSRMRRRRRLPVVPGWARLRDWWAIPYFDEWLEPERLEPPPRSLAAAFRRRVRRGAQNS